MTSSVTIEKIAGNFLIDVREGTVHEQMLVKPHELEELYYKIGFILQEGGR